MKEKKDKQYNLEELLKKSPMEITQDEMQFVLEHMDMNSLLEQASQKLKKDLLTVKNEQNN